MNSIYNDFFKTEVNSNNTKEIDELYIEETSKTLLKKMIQFMENYCKGTEKNKIAFRISLETDSKKTIEEIASIIKQASNTYQYGEKQITYLSFYQIENIDKIDFNTILLIKDLEAFKEYEQEKKNKLIHLLKEKIENRKIVLITGTKEELQDFFFHDQELEKLFAFKIIGENPTIQEMYNNITTQLDLEDSQKRELLNYIEKTYQNKDADTYLSQIIEYITFYKKIPELEKTKSTKEVFQELNELVGLNKIKQTLNELVDLITFKSKTGLKINNINLHMVFLGNPGTGKTTVARMICNILFDLKYIKENKLIEVSAKDLVGEYVGQTGPKTMAVIEKAMGGVLFIDEAYALKDDGKNSYNGEAIATLIKAMEDYRDQLVVIFAGYTKEMQAFLNSNSGIVSRIGYTLEFEDYTTEELKQIFINMTKKAGFIIDKEVLEQLEILINENKNTKNFGNARFIRNIYEKTILKHATNTKNTKNKNTLKTITKEDIRV